MEREPRMRDSAPGGIGDDTDAQPRRAVCLPSVAVDLLSRTAVESAGGTVGGECIAPRATTGEASVSDWRGHPEGGFTDRGTGRWSHRDARPRVPPRGDGPRVFSVSGAGGRRLPVCSAWLPVRCAAEGGDGIGAAGTGLGVVGGLTGLVASTAVTTMDGGTSRRPRARWRSGRCWAGASRRGVRLERCWSPGSASRTPPA